MWQMPNGAYLSDSERNFLNIPAEYGDKGKIDRLEEVARSYGITEGKAIFFPGHHRVSEEEFEHQRERMRSGLVPDTEDVGAILDDMRYKNAGGK